MAAAAGPARPHIATLAMIQIDRDDTQPLHQQLYSGIRQAILRQQYEPGIRLPSTRVMAATLGVSRNTVLNAIEQLYAEGYLESRVGAGTFVTTNLPEELLFAESAPQPLTEPSSPRTLSRRGQLLNQARGKSVLQQQRPPEVIFEPGVSALDAFPFDIWTRLHRRFCRQAAADRSVQMMNPAGHLPLRQNIASFLKATRAIECAADQIIITSGSQEALYLAAQVLLDRGNKAFVEQPGYMGTFMAVTSSGGKVVPIHIDDEGLDIEYAQQHHPEARAAFITPSHQFPLGVTMSLKRRLEMLTWADKNDGWIVEDDYDSIYRYEGQPLAALQGLDAHNRVLYVGTFSKVLFSGLRLGYVVVPEDVVDAFIAMRSCIDLAPPVTTQIVLNQFIEEGHFSRHLRRMLNVYMERRDAFINAVKTHLDGAMILGPCDSGMHATGYFQADVDDIAVAQAALDRGVRVTSLSRLFWGKAFLSGITFGFVNLTPAQIDHGMHALAAAYDEVTGCG